MITYNIATKEVVIEGIIFFDEDVDGLHWPVKAPPLHIKNCLWISIKPKTIKSAWTVSKTLAGYIWQAWKGVLL